MNSGYNKLRKNNSLIKICFVYLIIVVIFFILLIKNRIFSKKCDCKIVKPINNKVQMLKTQQDKTVALVKSMNTTPILTKKQKIYTLILIKTKKALNRLDIPFFLSSGTCLGYFREGKFIDWDYDIDVGIFAEDYTDDIVNEMKKEGLVLYRVLGNKETGMELSFRLPKTALGKYAKIDIFLHYRTKEDNEKNKIYWVSYMAPRFKKKIKYKVNDFKIKEVKFMGLNVFVPYPTINYIEEHYGKDWMIPKKPFSDYIYYKSPKSITSD